jgi:hypothetical protein
MDGRKTIRKDLGRSGQGLIRILSRNLPAEADENHDTPESGQPTSRPNVNLKRYL